MRESRSRADISRANAQHSTGPRTPEGKRRVSQNATKHGLYAKAPVIRGEDATLRNEFDRTFSLAVNPTNPLEYELSFVLADAAWRRRRYNRIEAEIFEHAYLARDAEIACAIEDGDLTDDRIAGADAALGGELGRRLALCAPQHGHAVNQYLAGMRTLASHRLSRAKAPHLWNLAPVLIDDEVQRMAVQLNLAPASYSDGSTPITAAHIKACHEREAKKAKAETEAGDKKKRQEHEEVYEAWMAAHLGGPGRPPWEEEEAEEERAAGTKPADRVVVRPAPKAGRPTEPPAASAKG